MTPIFVVSVLSGVESSMPVLSQCLEQVRRHYSAAPLVLITDGDRNVDYQDIAAHFRARRVNGIKLNVGAFGGAHLYRTYSEGLREIGDLIIRMDPAAYLWRPFKDGPAGEYAGYVDRDQKVPVIHSGCSSLSVNAARAMLEDFRHERYQQPAFSCGPSQLPSSEAITADVASRRGIPLTAWDEVCPFPLTSAAIYAVTHGYSTVLSS